MLVEEIQHFREYLYVAQVIFYKRQNVGYHGTKLFPLNQIIDLEPSGEIHNSPICLDTDSISLISFE
jgi:hypothetical protein